MRLRGGFRSKHERTIASATVTFWCMTVVPAGAPTISPIRSPTLNTEFHQPSPQARAPRVFHSRAYCSSRRSASAGIAPSEWLIRYVVDSRIGKRSRYSMSSTCAVSLETPDRCARRMRDPVVAAAGGQDDDRARAGLLRRDDAHRLRVEGDDHIRV